MTAKGLKQSDMAQILGVSLDRVKSLTSGRVAKLAPEESKALVQKLHVRSDYLVTGNEPIFQSSPEVELDASMGLLKEASTTVQTLAMPARYQMFVRDILFGVALKKAELLVATIDGFLAEHGSTTGQPKRPNKKT